MEYLDGESLRQALNERYLGNSALGIMRQLAAALDVIHKKRIIHRDLKPDSVCPEEDGLNFGWTLCDPRWSSVRTETNSRRGLQLRQDANYKGMIPLCRS
jgi:tRNA A-37 threonylcarbamoyl transferase component Bud32